MNFINCEFCNQKFKFLENNFFCDKCKKLNAININITYFDYLRVDAKLPIDIKLLDSNYIALLSLYHSDNFINKDYKEQLNSISHSSYLNNAYLTLKDIIKSIKYLYFVLFKDDILDENQILQDDKKELIKKFFHLNEELDNINNDKHKKEYFERIDSLYNEVMNKIIEIFNNKSNYKMIKNLYIELLYIKRIKDRI